MHGFFCKVAYLQGFIKIIGGKWRSRRLKVLQTPELRPTPSRVRETLFNWLAPYIQAARCLDLFAGSGVLGFEALSRGAGCVVMVEQQAELVAMLRAALAQFNAKNAIVYHASVPPLPQMHPPFDIVFLDPPYRTKLLLPCCMLLEEQCYLNKTAHIYLEAQYNISDNMLPASWHIIKCKQAGQVIYHLAERIS